MLLAEFQIVLKLVREQARYRPGRVLLTSLSTIAAACIVVWVVSGYDSLVAQFGNMGGEYVGRYEMLLLPKRNEEGAQQFARGNQLSQEFLQSIQQDTDVALAEPVFEIAAAVTKSGAAPVPRKEIPSTGDATSPGGKSSGPRIMGGMEQLRSQSKAPTLVATDSAEPLHTLVEGRWLDPKPIESPEGVLTRDSAEFLGVRLGEAVAVATIGTKSADVKVKIVGIVEQPKRLPGPKFMVGLPPTRAGALLGGPASNALYVNRSLVQKIMGAAPRISYIGLVLKPGVNADDFLTKWTDRFVNSFPPVEVRTAARVDNEVSQSTTFETVRTQAYSATAISLLAALFIIFTTLSMGVDERIRQFAILRAVAFTKWQIAVLIALESLFLGILGWVGGLLAGWGLLKIMAQIRPQSLYEGASLGTWCIVLSGVCALGGSLAAAILPAWRATRVNPLEAMAPRRPIHSGRLPLLMTISGLLLIAINPLVIFVIPMQDTSRYAIAAAIGYTTQIIGFVCLAPLAIIFTERLLGPLLARLLRLNRRLLATQLSSNMWRTAGTTVTLTIGLGLFVATQTWGYSMLAPFTPGEWAPDLLVYISRGGVPDSEIDAVRNVPGVIPEKFLPLAVKQVKFAEDITGFKIRPSATRQDTCVMVGVDPDLALGGEHPLFPFQFVEGSPSEAIQKLKQGRYCLVPDHFTRESGLGVGQKFAVLTSEDRGQTVEYVIAGVVSMPGWHWLSKTGFRRGRAAGLMFGNFDTVRADFKTGPTTMFWGNTNGKASNEQIKASIQAIVDRRSMENPKAIPSPTTTRAGTPRRDLSKTSVTLQTAQEERDEVRDRADKIIWALSELPLVTLLVTSLGLINTVLSSIRARRWDLGVLRALGVTRFGLFRLIVAESILIGVVAILLSLGFGTLAGYCGTGVTRYVNIRGGQYTPMVIPWAQLAEGFAIALSLCLLAAIWPAFRTGRTEPLRLLQAGRAAG